MFPSWLIYSMQDTHSDMSQQYYGITIAFNVMNRPNSWRDSIDGSILDYHNCGTREAVRNNSLGIMKREQNGDTFRVNIEIID